MHETLYRGTAREVLFKLKEEEAVKGKIFGEITIVISPFVAVKNENIITLDINHLVKTLEDHAQSKPKDLAKILHYITGWNQNKIRKILYKNSKGDTMSEIQTALQSEKFLNYGITKK